MVGYIVGYVVAGLLGWLSVGMFRHTDWWVDFFRQALTEPGRKLNRMLITRSSIKMQAATAGLFSLIFTVLLTVTLLSPRS